MKESTKGMISLVAVVLVLSFAGWMAYKNWTTGGDESDYEIICLGGHQYYRANWVQKALLGIRLTDDGKPVNCDREQS